MTEEDNKNKYITEEYLDKKLDERFSEQTQVILAAFDKRFDQLDKHLGQTENKLRNDINNVQTLIDGYVKAQESFRQEFEIMKNELGQIKKIIKENLGLDVSAV